MDEIIHLERNNTNNPVVLKLTAVFREKLIEKKIEDSSDLIKSNKIEEINSLIVELRGIDPNSGKIIELEKILNQKTQKSDLEKAQHLIAETEKEIRELIKSENYDQAIMKAKGILEVDPENENIRKLLVKAENLLPRQNKKLSIEAILKNKEKLEREYKEDKDKFIKL